MEEGDPAAATILLVEELNRRRSGASWTCSFLSVINGVKHERSLCPHP